MMDRRTFLKSSAIIGATIGIAPVLLKPLPQQESFTGGEIDIIYKDHILDACRYYMKPMNKFIKGKSKLQSALEEINDLQTM